MKRLVVHDLHPDYLSTRWAQQRRKRKFPVQHHHAHIASCVAKSGLNEQIIRVAFDGAGYGVDGQIWGGEFAQPASWKIIQQMLRRPALQTSSTRYWAASLMKSAAVSAI